MGRVLPRIKRFLEGKTGVLASTHGDARGRLNRSDFMMSDLTGTARFYGR
jgi:hypothetical protein